jgi:hypothetical protein
MPVPRGGSNVGSGDWHAWPEPRKRLYRTWLNIRNRCTNPRRPDYKYYGGRGIRVCSWWDWFVQFEKDMGPHPGPGWTLDREDNNGNYDPDNCRWVTRKTQSQNRNYCALNQDMADDIRELYSIGGIRQVDLAKIYGVTQGHISHILLRKNWL